MKKPLKAAGIRYLTNEYIVKALTNPVVIIALFTGIILFVGYCIYEMAYLAVCFETKRKGNNASIIDNIYNAYLRLKNLIRIQSIPLFLFFFISIIFINVTIVANLIYSFVKYLIPATFIQRLMAAVNIGYITATASNLYVSSNRITCRLLLRSSLTLFLRLSNIVHPADYL